MMVRLAMPGERAEETAYALKDRVACMEGRIERQISETIQQHPEAAITDEVTALQREVADLKLKLAEATGAIDVLRTGRMLRLRGHYEASATYKAFDVVMIADIASDTRYCLLQSPGEPIDLGAPRRRHRGFRSQVS
jgi:hypothetical protein